MNRVKKLGSETGRILNVKYSQLVMKVIDQLYNNIPTHIIDELTAEQCASLCTKHVDYATLASRIIVSNNHKNTPSKFSDAMSILYNFRDIHDRHAPILHEDIWRIIEDYKDEFDNMIDYNRDYLIDYFGFKTLERAYLMRS